MLSNTKLKQQERIKHINNKQQKQQQPTYQSTNKTEKQTIKQNS
jgi:hypothetical protein